MTMDQLQGSVTDVGGNILSQRETKGRREKERGNKVSDVTLIFTYGC